jgi:hypothetical protein
MRSMADTKPHASPHDSDAMVGPHGSMDDHGETHGHDDHAHGDDAMTLGPIDQQAWGAALAGVAAGLVVALVFAFSNL